MPDDAPRPEDKPRTAEGAAVERSEVGGEELGLLAATVAVRDSTGEGGPITRELKPVHSVPTALWPDIPGVFFPEPYALNYDWQEGVPEVALRALEDVRVDAADNSANGASQPASVAYADYDDTEEYDVAERTLIDLETGDLEMVDEEELYGPERTIPDLEMEQDPDETPTEVIQPPRKKAPDSIQPLEAGEIEEIVEAEPEPEPAPAAAPTRTAPPPTPPAKTSQPKMKAAKAAPSKAASEAAPEAGTDRAGAARKKAAPPLPPDATGQHEPRDPTKPMRAARLVSGDEAVEDEARVLPLDKVRPYRRVQGPRPTNLQPNLIEAALGADPTSPGGSLSGSAKPWYEAIFDNSFFDFLPKNLHKQTRREAAFISDSLKLADGAKVLDLACGFGRHAIELAKRGYDVTGIDYSDALIQKARGEATRRKMPVEFHVGDMRSLDYSGSFDGAVLMGNSFGYFDDQTNLEVLEGIRQSLKPRGRFLLHALNRDRLIRELPEVIWWRGQDALVLEEIEFDPETSRMASKRTIVFDDGRPPWEQFIEIRLYSLHELYTVLESTGFRVADISGSPHYRSIFFTNESRDLLILAERERDYS